MTFDLCWDAFPHCLTPRRSDRSVSEARYNDIISIDGLKTHTIDDSAKVALFHKATPEELLEGCKAMAMTQEDKKYSPGFQVWLNKGRWKNWSSQERQELARKYDAREAKRAEYLKVVK